MLAINIVSVVAEIFTGEASMVVLPAVQGEIGILPGHAPLLTHLKPGYVRIHTTDKKVELVYVSGGMVEVQPRQITVLADVAFRTAAIEQAAAEEARQRTAEALQQGVPLTSLAAVHAELMSGLEELRDLRKQRHTH